MQTLASYPVRHFIAVHRGASADAVTSVIRRYIDSIPSYQHTPLALGPGKMSLENYAIVAYVDDEVADEFTVELTKATEQDAPYSSAEIETFRKNNARLFQQIPIENAITTRQPEAPINTRHPIMMAELVAHLDSYGSTAEEWKIDDRFGIIPGVEVYLSGPEGRRAFVDLKGSHVRVAISGSKENTPPQIFQKTLADISPFIVMKTSNTMKPDRFKEWLLHSQGGLPDDFELPV